MAKERLIEFPPHVSEPLPLIRPDSWLAEEMYKGGVNAWEIQEVLRASRRDPWNIHWRWAWERWNPALLQAMEVYSEARARYVARGYSDVEAHEAADALVRLRWQAGKDRPNPDWIAPPRKNELIYA
jgi:hypothetical protein